MQSSLSDAQRQLDLSRRRPYANKALLVRLEDTGNVDAAESIRSALEVHTKTKA